MNVMNIRIVSALIFSLGMVLFFNVPSHAQDINCAEPMDQRSMNICAKRGWRAADGDLNSTYKMAVRYARELASFTEDDSFKPHIVLRNAQRKWISFRDLACEVEGSVAHGGTMEPAIYFSCLERLTRQRTEDLRSFAETN